jgi:hypothetical protein
MHGISEWINDRDGFHPGRKRFRGLSSR